MRLDELGRRLGHPFERAELLRAALVHRSYAAENPGESDNERLEFLGDAVLQLVVTELLYSAYPDLTEGEMAKVRAASVNRSELARVARTLGLGDHLLVGAGEEATGGRDKDSILADTMEAVIAAIYLDGGISAARRFIVEHWEPIVAEKAEAPGARDYKTRYQEYLAARGKKPTYRVVGEGPDHAKRFTATVSVDGVVTGTGEGRSKKEAEQEAARKALGGEVR
ncbi:MAG: ribonuclease 3 [Acidimicrobiia bacterium]|nr:MAG: ribonuclease 3 [Acidimicrobiia bacterium]